MVSKYWSETKRCRRCRKDRSLTQYGIDKRFTDGLSYVCRSCEGRPKKRSHWDYPRRLRPEERREIFARDRGRCFFCRKPAEWEAHTLHMLIPRARRGVYLPYNLRVAHPGCADQHKERADQLGRDLAAPEDGASLTTH